MTKVLLFLFLFPVFSWSQKLFTLEVISKEKSEILSKISYKKSFTSKSEREKEIRNILFNLYDNAYLSAEIENEVTDEKDSLKEIAVIKVGEQYKWVILRKGNADEGILSEAGFREKIYLGKPFYYKELRKLEEKILSYCENNGYPFASVKLDSMKISGEKISASLNLQKNILIKIDSVANRGVAKISSVYLQSYLGIKNGDLYNESLVKKIGTRIKELPFAKEKIPFRVLFPGENAKVELFLEKKRASQFDGIVGMLPDNKTGKILFTGDVRLKLNNSFNRGELLELNWRRLQASTQDLKTHFTFPFLFKTPFGIDADFKLYKKDSTYLEVNPNIGIQYHLSGENYFKVFVNRKQLTLLSTKGLEHLTTLPPYADITSSLYGISVKFEKLDYRLNPRKGYSLIGTIAAGNKIIKKNAQLDGSIYIGLKLNSVQYNSEIDAQIFFPIKNRSTIKFANKSAYLYNENLFLNELFRIGGLKTLRGFDEESIYASAFSIFTLEYRFLFEENSYLFFFGDDAYYENQSISFSGARYDTPYGFGAGISFETKAGIFSINYALGSQLGNPIDLKTGKVHFGIVNYF
ncbi:MAG: BamA/TamA family outer membrane protein [Bacteroidetes bacterium]|nr:BamA/TamA family outer membrane protein [Bacteroidota bacterium]